MPSETPGRWRFEWRRTWPDIWAAEFQQRWRGLLDRSPSANVYHVPDLVRAWAETCGHGDGIAPMFGVASDGSGAELLLPWVVVKYRGRFAVRRVLEPAGGDLFGYHDPLVAGRPPADIDWRGFWLAARDETREVCDQSLFRFLQPFSAPDDVRLPSEDSPVLHLDGCHNLDDVLARCSSKHRIDVKRQLRRLGEKGVVSFWSAGPGDRDAALAELRGGLLPAYRALWSQRTTVNTLLRPGLEDFLARVVEDGVPAGWTHVSALKVDGVSIAWHLGFLFRGAMYWWLPTHDADWSAFSPGKLMLAELLDAGCRDGWTALHMLTGNHDYKAAWQAVPQPLAAVGWTAPSLRGRVIAWYDQTRRTS